jgi:auxin responsive GH3 family protein
MYVYAGLYRYRLGDVVKVAGFYNATPKLKFVCRRNLMLSINIDKNSEQDLQLAVDAAARAVLAGEKLEVVDYTSHADVSSDPGHYVVFLELNAADPAAVDGDVMQACCDELDRAFADAGYVGSRKSGAIAPLELRVLQRGTFQKVLRHYLSLGAPVSQFKSPRCVSRSNSGVLQILAGCTVNVFFSSAYD